MAYDIFYTAKALRYMESIDKKQSYQLYKKIQSIKDNPLHYIGRLANVNLWKLRIGDYRAIIRFDRAKQEITVVDIGHRKNVYKNI